MLARIAAPSDAKREHWMAEWSLERFDPQQYRRRNGLDITGTMTLAEV